MMPVTVPKLITSVKIAHRYRYIISTAISTPSPITRGFCLNTLLLNLGSGSNWRVVHAVRLVSLTAFLPALGAVSGTSNFSLTWASENAPQETITESNVGSTMQMAVFRPPKDSLSAYWSASGQAESVPVLFIQGSAGVLIDVKYQFIITGYVSGPTAVSTTNSGTAGVIYSSYFDGPQSGASLVPVGTLALN